MFAGGGSFDAMLLLATLEPLGLTDAQLPLHCGDLLMLNECRRLLKPGGRLVMTVSAGVNRVTARCRQYDPAALRLRLRGWTYSFTCWGWNGTAYVPIREADAARYENLADSWGNDPSKCPGAVIGLVAQPERQGAN